MRKATTFSHNTEKRKTLLTKDNSSEFTISKKILLVEDSPVVQHVHMEYLKELGYEADLAQDGEEALAIFNKGYALILLDIGLPKIDGIKVGKEIRKYEQQTKSKPIIIVALTGFSLVIKKECEKAGMNDFQTKPIEINKLDKILKKWL